MMVVSTRALTPTLSQREREQAALYGSLSLWERVGGEGRSAI